MNLFEYRRGTIPLMISIPHAGTWIPDEIQCRLTEEGKRIKDTDWFLQRLYDFEDLADASLIASNVSRYVVDLNRDKDDTNLYPGHNTTGLCPVKTFDGDEIYLAGFAPDEAAIQARINDFWRPYHQQLRAELDLIIERFGFVVLLDAHSIASELPWLFAGRLQDFNFGTNHGQTCAVSLQRLIETYSAGIEEYSSVVNGRFVGGYITRHYGKLKGVNAVQLEQAQITYMNEDTLVWDQARVEKVQPVIRAFVQTLRQWDDLS